MAGALHLRGDAAVSHAPAGFVWRMLEDEPTVVELTVAGRFARPQPGIRLHRTAALHPDDIRWRHGIPVTAPGRTVVDLAGILDDLELENVLAVCRDTGIATERQIRAAIERAPANHAGVGRLRTLLERGGFRRTRSYYERRLLQLIRKANLPLPQTNRQVSGHNVDFMWQQQRVIAEFDGFRFHAGRRAFETDRRRDQDLVAAGYRVIRITARQLEDEPLAVIARLAVILGAAV
jgi:very-short-patch-repair endonuclease